MSSTSERPEMSLAVSDARSNPNDQIAHAAKVIGKSKHRAAVFKAIYTGRKRIKTVSEIAALTNLPRKRVLEEGVKLAKQHIVKQTKLGETAYERDDFFSAQRDKILRLASLPRELAKFPTKYSKPFSVTTSTIRIPKQLIQTEFVTIDDIETFKAVRGVQPPEKRLALPEQRFKRGVQALLGELGKFTDWGGELNDLFGTNLHLRMDGRRRRVAFGFKGPGTKGPLTPKKLGKNGDQIQRLFQSPSDIFIVQYWREIEHSVISQMTEFAKAKSVSEGRKIWFGTIDGRDSDRLVQAYPSAFLTALRAKKRTKRAARLRKR